MLFGCGRDVQVLEHWYQGTFRSAVDESCRNDEHDRSGSSDGGERDDEADGAGQDDRSGAEPRRDSRQVECRQSRGDSRQRNHHPPGSGLHPKDFGEVNRDHRQEQAEDDREHEKAGACRGQEYWLANDEGCIPYLLDDANGIRLPALVENPPGGNRSQQSHGVDAKCDPPPGHFGHGSG